MSKSWKSESKMDTDSSYIQRLFINSWKQKSERKTKDGRLGKRTKEWTEGK